MDTEQVVTLRLSGYSFLKLARPQTSKARISQPKLIVVLYQRVYHVDPRTIDQQRVWMNQTWKLVYLHTKFADALCPVWTLMSLHQYVRVVIKLTKSVEVSTDCIWRVNVRDHSIVEAVCYSLTYTLSQQD